MHVSATEPDLRGHTGARAAVEDPETHHSTGTGQCQGVLTGRGVRGRPTGGWGCVNGSNTVGTEFVVEMTFGWLVISNSS